MVPSFQGGIPMAGMTWLHLSDWHQRGKDFDRDVVLDALIEDIRNRTYIHADLAKLDFLIFSGDVAFSGQANEYKKARKYLFAPSLKITGLNRNRLFIVPGNHDLDREEFNYIPDEIKQPFTTEKQVQTWLTDDKNRNHMLKPFAAYEQFVREYTGQEQPAYSYIRRFLVDGIRVALLGLNSALMCGRNKHANGEVNDQSHLFVGEPQLYKPLKQVIQAQVRIAVLHHPFEWLAEFDRDRVENRLRRECHFILCGHQHKPNISVERGMVGDCVIIPAGASYDTRVARNPRHTNSYNFVHLDFEKAQGTIYLRRWSDSRDRWVEDIDSHEGGMVQFPLPDSLRNIAPSSVPSIPNNVYILKSPSENFLEEVQGYITEAQKCVQAASAPFNTDENITQKQFKKAIRLLNMTNVHMQHLRKLLDAFSPLPTVVASQNQNIIYQLDIIAEQIDDHLIPCLRNSRLPREDIWEKFKPVKDALNKFGILIPAQKAP